MQNINTIPPQSVSLTFFQEHEWQQVGFLHLLVERATSQVKLRIVQSDIVPQHPLFFFNDVMYTSLPKLKAAIELAILAVIPTLGTKQ